MGTSAGATSAGATSAGATSAAGTPSGDQLPDAGRCPGCRTALPARPDRDGCTACGLRLHGPDAQRLWQVDTELLAVAASRARLTTERNQLLDRLHAPDDPADARAPARTVRQGRIDDSSAQQAGEQDRSSPEWTPRRVQNLLLLLGGLLVTVAALVFTAVTYDRFGAAGRAGVLIGLTLLAGSLAPVLLRRRLTATAETVGGLAVVLASLDAYGLRTLGFAYGTGALTYAAGSAAVLAIASGAYARLVPLRVVRCAAVALAQVPVPLLLVDHDASALDACLALAAVAAADLAALAAVRRRIGGVLRVSLVAAATAVTGASLVAALTAAGQRPAGAYGLLAVAGLLAAGALLAPSLWLRTVLSAAPVPLLALAALAPARDLTGAQRPLVPAAVALLIVVAAGLQRPAWRAGPVAGALAVTGTTLLAVAAQVGSGLAVPASWLTDPWSLAEGSTARDALGVALRWDGSVLTLVVVCAATATLAVAAAHLPHWRILLPGAGALAVTALALVPLGTDLGHATGLGVLLLEGSILAGVGVVLHHRFSRNSAFGLGAGTALGLQAVVWSTATERSTLWVLALATGLALTLAAATSPRRRAAWPAATGPAAAATGLLTGASLAAYGAHLSLAAEQVGGLLLVAVAVIAAVAARLGSAQQRGADLAAVVVAASAIVAAAPDPGWLSWVLAGTGLIALGSALRPGRQAVAVVGAVLLSASSWVRLADAGVRAPEPYVVPLALAALALGVLRRRRRPTTGSWPAYGAGLSLLLVPSLVASLDDASPTRGLLWGLVCLVVVLVGARRGLKAPLLIGAAVLAVHALALLAPYASALPRWSTLGAAGTLLVAVGATYEQRRRDLQRLRHRYDGLA